MQDYVAYRDHTEISSIDMVKALRPRFRGFTKNIMSYLNQPEKYGICLTPEAEEIIVNTFGSGPGLAHRKFQKKRPERRTKQNRMTVRIDDDLYFRLLSLETVGETYPTMQAVVEAALRDFVDKKGYTDAAEG